MQSTQLLELLVLRAMTYMKLQQHHSQPPLHVTHPNSKPIAAHSRVATRHTIALLVCKNTFGRTITRGSFDVLMTAATRRSCVRRTSTTM